ncbi:hypothetical protein Lbir_1673 [Legionella birminghamensis]|uniref:Uncharacterized protein n=1 Tax=Legionella birminghamensis TaxID=28083 RepID=A0A378I8B8_9GAMM|nr:hypothetical protein [Legionella birminghamensis]KTC71521.1 hypothetical protein Lbir_1673 [Legionella birminghamensis]STX30871.1 Uncharacterised protein [Legionella birminghamensis]
MSISLLEDKEVESICGGDPSPGIIWQLSSNGNTHNVTASLQTATVFAKVIAQIPGNDIPGVDIVPVGVNP